MLNLFIELWNSLPDDIRIPRYDTGLMLLRLIGGASCRYYEDASIAC